MQSRSDILNAIRSVEADAGVPSDAPIEIAEHATSALARPAHVREVFVAPTAAQVLEHEDARLALFTRQVDTPKGSFCWLVIGGRLENPDRWLITDAFRLYGSADAVAVWAGDPGDAFAEILDRFGLEYEVAGSTVRFAPFVRVPMDSNDPGQALMAGLQLDPSRSFKLSQSMRITDDGELHLAFGYFIDTSEYERAAQSGRR
jgi:hypothetical protein